MVAVTHLSQYPMKRGARHRRRWRRRPWLQSHTCHNIPSHEEAMGAHEERRASQEKVEKEAMVAVTHLSHRSHEERRASQEKVEKEGHGCSSTSHTCHNIPSHEEAMGARHTCHNIP